MKKILSILIALIILAGTVGLYLYNKPVRSIRNKKADISISADSLFSAFEADENAANKTYLNKVIEVSGKIQSVDSDTSGLAVTLQSASGMFGVICKMENSYQDPDAFTRGQSVQLKGICTGYLMDVVLVSCVALDE